MAENFGNVVKALEKATKKPSAGKAPVVLAVQLVDKTGKVIESGKGAPGAAGASAAEAGREEKATQTKQTILFEQMANSMAGSWATLKALNKSFLESVKEKGKMGLGIIIAAIAAPIIVLVAFFKQLAAEFMFLKKLTGKGLTKLFAPLKSLFTGGGPVGKAFAGLNSTIKTISSTIKGSKGFKAIGEVGTKIKGVIASLTKFMKPATDFFKSVFGMADDLAKGAKTGKSILGFAKTFGTVLGKIFLPITILMSAFDFITGFMEGYEEEGILGGLEGGLTKLFQGLIGMPLDLLKSAVSWILGVFGWDSAEKWLDSFSFSTLIGDMISGMFDMIGKVVDWIKLLFSDPVAALKILWSGLLGTFKTLTDILMWPVNKAINWVMDLFKWGDPKKTFSIGSFIFGEPDGVISKVISWVKKLFSWGDTGASLGMQGASLAGMQTWSLSLMVSTAIGKAKEWVLSLFSLPAIIGGGDTWIMKTIKGVIESVKTWLGNMFKFDSTSNILASAFNVLTFLPNIIFKGLQLVSKWLLKLFGFDSAAESVANADDWTIGSMIVTAFKKVKEWIVGLFTFVSGTIAGTWTGVSTFITDMFGKVVKWFSKLWTWAEAGVAGTWTGVSTFITDMFGKVVKWFSKLWSWGDDIGKKVAGTFTGLGSMIGDVFTKVKDWFFGIFGFGTDEEGKDKPIQVKEAEGFSLSTMIGNVVKSIKEFFWHPDGKSGILQFDLASALPDFEMPDLGKAIGQLIAGIFPDDWVLGKGFVGTAVNLVMPNSLIDMLKNIKGLAAGGPMGANQPMIVGEMGPEMILPNQGGQVLNAQRTQQMLQSGIQRDMGSGAGGGGTTSINTGGNVVSSPTTNYVNNGTAARRPIILAA